MRERFALFYVVERPGVEELFMALRWGKHSVHKARVSFTLHKSDIKLELKELQVVGITIDEDDPDFFMVTLVSHVDVYYTATGETVPAGRRFNCWIQERRNRHHSESCSLALRRS